MYCNLAIWEAGRKGEGGRGGGNSQTMNNMYMCAGTVLSVTVTASSIRSYHVLLYSTVIVMKQK